MKLTARIIASAALVLGFSASAMSAPVGGLAGNVTPGVIYGSGNANGSFTGQIASNIEVGLRAHLRHPTPQNVFNYDGNNTYSFQANPAVVGLSVFNVDWTINVDQNGSGIPKLGDFTYLLSVDTDASMGTAYTSGSPFSNPFYFDHSMGDNSTTAATDVVAGDFLTMLLNMTSNSVAQNSFNLAHTLLFANPGAVGHYGFKLEVMDEDMLEVLSSSEIFVNVSAVPIPAALPLLAGALGLFGFASHRRRKRTAAWAHRQV